MIAAQELTMRAGLDPHLRHEQDGLIILAQWVGPPGEPSLSWTVLRSEPGGYPSGARYLSGAHDLSLADAHALIDLFRASREPAASIVAAYHRQLLTALDWPPAIQRFNRCGQPGCPHDAEPGLSLCEDCWDLANESRDDGSAS